MFCQNHSRLLMQFHITGRCNLRCKHCYRTEGDVEPLSLAQIFEIFEQFKTLLEQYNREHSTFRKGQINLTGGEPFARADIDQILRYLGENRAHFTYAILSNGSFLTEERIALLKKTGCSFIQLSIDGDQATHDALRAEGDYARVFKTAALLEKRGIRTYISFTANKENVSFLPQVAKECRKRKITKLWSDRLVPIGTGKEMERLALGKEDLPAYINALKKAQGNWLTHLFYPKTRVTMNRALQFQKSNGEFYACSAGKSLLTIDEFGNMMPCRRMPIHCGNVLQTPMSEIYYKNETFRQLRLPCFPKDCHACIYALLCEGGARCQSYARFGSFFRADPACPLVK